MDIKRSVDNVKERIANAAKDTGKKLEDITLIAITKTHPVALIEEALACGIEHIGESKVQEAEQKIPQLEKSYESFHFVGHLQSNKIKKLMPLKPYLIHSIDKYSTARKLNDYLKKKDIRQNILVQINSSGETSKYGIAPGETLAFIQKLSALSHVRISGLMTMAPFTDDENKIRESFQLTYNLFKQLTARNIPNVEMRYLSMGMTNDFEIAIKEGANMVRIGSAIFGKRYNRRAI